MSETFYCNCWVWARRQKRREGGYISWRDSVHWKGIPHYIWSKDLKTWWGFTPIDPKNNWKAVLDCLWFLGTIEEEKPELLAAVRPFAPGDCNPEGNPCASYETGDESQAKL